MSLATKPLVILTGLSGSGKTQIALRFGEWLGPGLHMLVPVRPDWTGSESLFGFEDALQMPTADGRRVWHVPAPLAFMLEAAAHPRSPYLLILDEMNLAHVERYFADVLSGMESGDSVLPNLRKEDDGLWRRVPGVEELIPFPRNLFVVGTVNVDETTYMFSPKVLDRANVFEFRVGTADLRTDLRKPVACRPGEDAIVSSLLAVATDDRWHAEHPSPSVARVADHMRELHGLLAEHSLEFGHRVFYESTRFSALLAAAGDVDPLAALDLVIMQKLLPKLHGSRRKLEPALRELGLFTHSLRADPEAAVTFDPTREQDVAPALPDSYEKIQRMIRSVRTNQFASFTE